MIKLNVVTFFFLISTFSTSFAQNPHADRLDPASLNQQGQIMNLKIVPADRNLQVFLIGKKGADVKLGGTKVTAKLRMMNRPSLELPVSRQKSYYSIPTDLLKDKEATQIELTTITGSDSETFKIDLK
jgi:hypothetical protein